MEWRKEVGLQIREARDDLHLTQDELAERVGVHKNMVSRWEKGSDGPTLEIFAKLSVILGTEFHIGEYALKAERENPDGAEQPNRQLRLHYGREYICLTSTGSSIKIKPAREGLLISTLGERETG